MPAHTDLTGVPHATGTVEHLLVASGRLTAGPADAPRLLGVPRSPGWCDLISPTFPMTSRGSPARDRAWSARRSGGRGSGGPPRTRTFLVAHGDLDPQVPAADARHFADRLRQTSAAPVVYAELRGGNHAFDLYHSLRFEAVIDAIEAFTAWVRSWERKAV
ncbi:hypothetical protein [Nonomuraea sp. NPDC003201]